MNWQSMLHGKQNQQGATDMNPSDIDHLSHSSVSTYLRCPRQWAFAYIEKLRRIPSVALLKGSAVDTGLSLNLEQKIETRIDLPVEDVLQVAEQSFRDRVDASGGVDEIEWDGSNLAKGIDSTINLTRLHMQEHAPHIQPTGVQLELHKTLPDGRDFVGYVDFVDEQGNICDWKTGKSRMGQSSADSDMQPTAYAYLMDRPDATFTFYRAIDTGKNVSGEVLETTRTTQQVTWYRDAVADVSAAIDAGVFPANPNGWHCSPKFCGFYDMCMSGRKPQV